MRTRALWFGLILFAIATMVGCGKDFVVPTGEHHADGCLQVCERADYVETDTKGNVCRCWSHSLAFQFTFRFPTTEEQLLKSRSEWRGAARHIEQCKARGFGWAPSPDKSTIMCVEPDEPEKEGEPESDDPPSPVDPHPETKA